MEHPLNTKKVLSNDADNAGLSRRVAGRFCAPGSPGAERREGHQLCPAFSLSEAKGE